MTARTVAKAMEKAEEEDSGLSKFLWSKARHFESILPDHVDVKAFLGTAWAALLADETLMANAIRKPDTLLIALFRCAAKGHQPGTEEYYLTPRDGGVLGIEGYRGVIERMYRSGAVAKVIVREVCAKDYFRYVEGEDDKPVHDFAAKRGGTTGADFFGEDADTRGAMVGVYAVAQLMTGSWSRPVLLSRADVFAYRAAGGWKGPDDKYSPWNRMDAGPDHPEFQGRSMWLKSGAKRLEPWVPTSAEYQREQIRATASVAAAQGKGIPEPRLAAVSGAETPAIDGPARGGTAAWEPPPGPARQEEQPRNHRGRFARPDGSPADEPQQETSPENPDGGLPVEDPPWPEGAEPGVIQGHAEPASEDKPARPGRKGPGE